MDQTSPHLGTVLDHCTPDHIESFRQAIRQGDVVNPDAEELAGLSDREYNSQDEMAAKVLEWGIDRDGVGSLVVAKKNMVAPHF